MESQHIVYIQQALDLAKESAEKGTGPFGAVIVQKGVVVAEGHNCVTKKNDPTAHAEVEAIRKAGETLSTFDLSDCILYTSSYPCPMCLGAVYWARIKKVFYANSLETAHKAGFDDTRIYQDLCAEDEKKNCTLTHLSVENAETPFTIWNDNPNKITY